MQYKTDHVLRLSKNIVQKIISVNLHISSQINYQDDENAEQNFCISLGPEKFVTAGRRIISTISIRDARL